jgi:hypothetical protein
MLNLFAMWLLWHFVFPLLAFFVIILLICMAFAIGMFTRSIRRRRG